MKARRGGVCREKRDRQSDEKAQSWRRAHGPSSWAQKAPSPGRCLFILVMNEERRGEETIASAKCALKRQGESIATAAHSRGA